MGNNDRQAAYCWIIVHGNWYVGLHQCFLSRHDPHANDSISRYFCLQQAQGEPSMVSKPSKVYLTPSCTDHSMHDL